jgi:hypothetical protein
MRNKLPQKIELVTRTVLATDEKEATTTGSLPLRHNHIPSAAWQCECCVRSPRPGYCQRVEKRILVRDDAIARGVGAIFSPVVIAFWAKRDMTNRPQNHRAACRGRHGGGWTISFSTIETTRGGMGGLCVRVAVRHALRLMQLSTEHVQNKHTYKSQSCLR